MIAQVREDFAAAGGASTGLAWAGYRGSVIGVEHEKTAAATAQAAGHRRIVRDVRAVRDMPWGVLEGYTAGPPCQTFSMAGNGKGRAALDHLVDALTFVYNGMTPEDAIDKVHDEALDERSILVLEPMLVITRHMPRWIILEQVRAVHPVWNAYAGLLRTLGYSVDTGIVHAEQYGVPQTRDRAILLASLDREVALPTPTHSRFHVRDPKRLDEGVEKWVSMAEALGFGMTDRPSMTVTGGGTYTGGAEVFGNGARQRMAAEMQAGRWMMGDVRSSRGTVRGDDQPAPTLTASMDNGNFQWVLRSNYGTSGDPDNRGERSIDEPAFTVTSKVGRNFFMAGQGSTAQDTSGQRPRPLDEPAHTIMAKGTAAWVYRNGNQENSAKRPLDEPAPTVHFGARSNKVEWMEKEAAKNPSASGLRVTPEQAACLQTFPVNYPWEGNKTLQYQQIGNACPPLLAKVLAEAVL